MKFLNKIVQFMYGRYGTDELNHFLLAFYVCCFIINLFCKKSWIFGLELLSIFIVFFRTFSKNTEARRREKNLFLKIRNYVKSPFKIVMKNIKDKDHIYKKCHKCKTILRLPLPAKKGVKHTKCPICKKKLTIFAYKYQKIEIIRKTNKKRKKR